MAISHLCLTCGLDLARVRPFRDPHYGLALILCPECGAGSARRRHPTIHRWRQVRRLIGPVIAIVMQILILGGVTSLAMVFCMFSAWQVEAGSPPGPDESADRIAVLILIALLSAAIGAWLTAGFAHWRRGKAWLALFVWIAVLMALDTLIVPAVFALVDRVITEVPALPYQMGLWLIRLIFLSGMFMIATAGIPVGAVLGKGWGAFRRTRWRARRRRLRRRRLT